MGAAEPPRLLTRRPETGGGGPGAAAAGRGEGGGDAWQEWDAAALEALAALATDRDR